MGLRTDIGTVLIVGELGGSSTTLGINMIVFPQNVHLIPAVAVATGNLLLDLFELGWFFSSKGTALMPPKRISEVPVTLYL